MASSEANITVTAKTKAGTLFTVRADSPEEFMERINSAVSCSLQDGVATLEELALMSKPGESFKADPVVAAVQAIGGTVVNETPVVQSSGFQPVPPPAVAQPPAQEGVSTETDRWGNRWTYGRPDAPVCAHGAMVLKQGTSKAGKSYAGWFDPAGGPRWTGGKVEQCEAKFGVKI